MGERVAIVVKVELNDDGSAAVEVQRIYDAEEGDREIPSVALMCAAEYLTHLVAQSSGLGYEGALEKIAEGAMTYRKEAEGTDGN